VIIAQGGFRVARSTLVQALFLLEICSILRKHHKVTPTLAFLDIKSAYDTVDRRHVWQVLEQSLDPALLNLLKNLFNDVQIEVLLGNAKSSRFMKFRLLSTKWFEIQTQITNRHLFDAVIFYKVMKEPMALGEFAGPMQNNDKTDHDTVKVYRNAMRVVNEIATKTQNGKIPRVYIILFHKGKLLFETLALIDNSTYVRTRHGMIKAPKTPDELKLVFTKISKVLSCGDTLVCDAICLHCSTNDEILDLKNNDDHKNKF
jgi:hypothetical protein